jgi:peroxiredoxin (alkyl hydroperoxide reductase subunit C)
LDILDGEYTDNENYLIAGDNVSYRATYIIDEEGTIVHESINHMPIGRNVNEYLRIIDAYTHVQTHGEVCPANWEQGKDAMNANRDGVASYLSSH